MVQWLKVFAVPAGSLSSVTSTNMTAHILLWLLQVNGDLTPSSGHHRYTWHLCEGKNHTLKKYQYISYEKYVWPEDRNRTQEIKRNCWWRDKKYISKNLFWAISFTLELETLTNIHQTEQTPSFQPHTILPYASTATETQKECWEKHLKSEKMRSWHVLTGNISPFIPKIRSKTTT